jgi:hypothetical protein
MRDLLADIALSYVQSAAPHVIDRCVLQQIHHSFAMFIAGCPADDLTELLLRHCHSTLPLDRICAILRVPDDPPPPDVAPPPEAVGAVRRKPRPWSPAEDDRLLAAIHRFGLDNWASVANFVGGGRQRAQCSQRWFRGLDPRISKNQWSVADELRLLQLVREKGSRGWTTIAAAMGNRSDVQCRYHFFQMQREGRMPVEMLRPQLPPCRARIPFQKREPPMRVRSNSLRTAPMAEWAAAAAKKHRRSLDPVPPQPPSDELDLWTPRLEGDGAEAITWSHDADDDLI